MVSIVLHLATANQTVDHGGAARHAMGYRLSIKRLTKAMYVHVLSAKMAISTTKSVRDACPQLLS